MRREGGDAPPRKPKWSGKKAEKNRIAGGEDVAGNRLAFWRGERGVAIPS